MNEEILHGLLLDDEVSLTLGELCRVCTVHAEWIIELVDEGILEPAGPDAAHWHFAGSSLLRIMRVRRLQQDLGINLAGAALVLDLLDEIDNLRTRIEVLERY